MKPKTFAYIILFLIAGLFLGGILFNIFFILLKITVGISIIALVYFLYKLFK